MHLNALKSSTFNFSDNLEISNVIKLFSFSGNMSCWHVNMIEGACLPDNVIFFGASVHSMMLVLREIYQVYSIFLAVY